MEYKSRRCRFTNELGIRLAGIVDSPAGQEPHAAAVFAPCFTCTRDLKAIAHISRRLAAHGFATLRFDFTGLGESGGEFGETSFDTSVADCVAAAEWVRQNIAAPQCLLGHSLGGAAMLTAAAGIPSARCLVNIASPVETGHLATFLAKSNPAIELTGTGEVTIGGRTHRISRQMLDVLRRIDHRKTLRELRLPLLILFSPEDETLPFENAREMFQIAGGPTSLVTIDGADHLLVNQPGDSLWVADCIAAWARRYLGT